MSRNSVAKLTSSFKTMDVNIEWNAVLKSNEKDQQTLEIERYANKNDLSWVFSAYRKIRSWGTIGFASCCQTDP